MEGRGEEVVPGRDQPTAWWSSDVLDTVELAVSSALAGRSTTVVVTGEPGTGKTTLLDDVVERAGEFRVLLAEGLLGSVSPYAALQQWGVTVPSTATPFTAAQSLRDRIDDLGHGAAVLLRLDDLQWADPESVETLVWLLRRASGDRLLALVGTRPMAAGQLPAWQRWSDTSSRVTTVRLTGLTQELALQLAHHYHPALPESTSRVLWTHTGGNPLYLSALLREYDPTELARMRVLPAPTEFEQLVTDRLERLDRDAVTVVQATAVLGTGWTPLPTLAMVAGVHDILGAADRAEAAGLVQVRAAHGALAVRPSHALARSAIYYGASLRERRELHLRAAAVAQNTELRLEHRLQAAMSFDDDLADELAAEAATLHSQRSYRLAGQFLEWASSVTADQQARERRRLDGLFERQLSGQQDAGVQEVDTLPSQADDVRLLLLLGHAALLDSRPSTAARLLRRAVDQPFDPGDHLPWSRAHVLLAAAHLRAGASAETILVDLECARSLGPTDPALRFREFYCQAVAMARGSTPEAILAQLSFLPDNVSEVLPEHNDVLGWRGVMRLVEGQLPQALVDLREAHARAAATDATTEVVDGALLAFIGTTHVMLGQWDRAQVVFTLLDEIAVRPQAIAQVYTGLLPSVAGDFDVADRRLAQATETVEQEPWQEAVQALFMTRVLRAHAGGDPVQQRPLLNDMRERWPHAFVDSGLVGSMWYLQAALAAVWADELALAEEWTSRLEGPNVPVSWAPAVSHWLRGLIAESRGQVSEALRLLRRAAELPVVDLSFHRAHLLSDYARLADLHHRTSEANTARSAAQHIYRQLGAAPYLAAQADVIGQLAPDVAAPPPGLRDRFGLSEREADVATLVADGMSYAQVARELFITRSTVGFHLGNIYAKAGVTSRHDLSELVRGLARSA